MFTFIIEEGKRRVDVYKDGIEFAYSHVIDNKFIYDQSRLDDIHESGLPNLLGMQWSFGYTYIAFFLRAIPLAPDLWWEVVAINSDWVYQVQPRLGFKPKLVNLVPHEVVVEALLKIRPEIDPKLLAVPKFKGVKGIKLWSLGVNINASVKIGKVVYYDLLDLPTCFKLVSKATLAVSIIK